MSSMTTQEVLDERPPTKRVTFADELQIETISNYSSTSSSSNEAPFFSSPPRPEHVAHEQKRELLIQPGFWYPPAMPCPQQPPRSIEHTEQLIDQTLKREMALYPEIFNKREQSKRILFVKVLKAETLDFPIEKGEAFVHCSIQYKDLKSTSHKQILSHTIRIEQHELRIEQADPNEQIIITLHVDQKKKSLFKRIRSKSSLDRYIHPEEGLLCQTTFSAHRFMNTDQMTTATLLLVNDWYRSNHPTDKHTMGKAVGKLYVQCLYLTCHSHHLPQSMDETNQFKTSFL